MVDTTIDAKIGVVQKELTRALCEFLRGVLPRLNAEGWWQEVVLPSLSHQQTEYVRRRGITDLSGLDLAALLRVFDANWWELSSRLSLPPECRHYLKELQSVGNRWAHAGAADEPADALYRDLDTAQRLIGGIAPEHDLVDALDELKEEVLGVGREQAFSPTAGPRSASPEAPNETPGAFSVGMVVRLRSDPSKTGAIIACLAEHPEGRYTLFIDGAQRQFYASQLLPPEEAEEAPAQIETAETFHARLTATEITHPGVSALFSLNAARVDFIPYQFRPVIKFIRADRPRLLIADSVGVGKTIEAGLILRELQARRDVWTVLIICPKPLVAERKWQTEMRRFDERFTHLDGPRLRMCIEETDLEGVWDPQSPRVIVPYSLLDEKLLHGSKGRRKWKGLLDLDPPPRFDLVIVDEAHHIRNPNTFSHQAVRFFCDNAEAVLFMTATPLQLGDDDLFVLLNTLRPDLVIDRSSYDEMAEPNPAINRAIRAARGADVNWQPTAASELASATNTPWGRAVYPSDPTYGMALSILTDESPDDRRRIEAISALEDLHSFAGIINRTRRRDIGDFAVRKPETVVVDFTPEQRELHDDLLAVQAHILSLLHGDQCVAFMMTTLKRQAASCIFGLAPMIEDILTRRLDELDLDDSEFAQEASEEAKLALEDAIVSVAKQAQALPADDPKLEALLKVVAGKQNAANNRIMVFSTFRHTLGYLEEKLTDAGVRVGLIHGGVDDRDRVAFRSRFMLPREDTEAIDVLLFSEVGCEGLDYQFCDTLVNYDLPWNPMRIEQRIGRLDRNGQQSETVLIYNLITRGTVDADIHDRCLMRIGVFESSVGECEEIFGDLTREIRAIAENAQLTEDERQDKLQQLSDNKIRLLSEQLELEENQKEFFGLDLSDQRFREDIEAAESYWLSPRALENLVSLYLGSLTESEAPCLLGAREMKTLRLPRAVRTAVLKELDSHGLPSTEASRRWRQRLRSDQLHIRATFEASAAANNPDVELLSPLHPLVQQAARSWSAGTDGCHTALITRHHAISKGTYPFVIYEWRYEGVRREVKLTPVCGEPSVTAKLTEGLAQAITWRVAPEDFPARDTFEALESHHYQLWARVRETHRAETRAVAEHQLRSLKTSHEARRRLLQEQLAQATDEKIRRMRQSQLNAANADYERRHKAIVAGLEKADIHAEPIAWGVLKAEGCDAS